MRFSVVAFLVLATLVNIVLGGERGFLSGFLNQKPVFIKVDLPFRPEAEASDKCSRQYPLIPRIRQQVPYGFRRYGVVPDLMQDPPANLLEVCCRKGTTLLYFIAYSFVHFCVLGRVHKH